MLLTGIVWLPCKLVIAAWASGCELNFTNAQPARRAKEERKLNKICRNLFNAHTDSQREFSSYYAHHIESTMSNIYERGKKNWNTAPTMIFLGYQQVALFASVSSICNSAFSWHKVLVARNRREKTQREWNDEEWEEEIKSPHNNNRTARLSTSCLNKWKNIFAC
jgi:hypothetical protein